MNAKKLVMLLAVVAIAVGAYFMFIKGDGEEAKACETCCPMIEAEDGTKAQDPKCECKEDCASKKDDKKDDDKDDKKDDDKKDDDKKDA